MADTNNKERIIGLERVLGAVKKGKAPAINIINAIMPGGGAGEDVDAAAQAATSAITQANSIAQLVQSWKDLAEIAGSPLAKAQGLSDDEMAHFGAGVALNLSALLFGGDPKLMLQGLDPVSREAGMKQLEDLELSIHRKKVEEAIVAVKQKFQTLNRIPVIGSLSNWLMNRELDVRGLTKAQKILLGEEEKMNDFGGVRFDGQQFKPLGPGIHVNGKRLSLHQGLKRK